MSEKSTVFSERAAARHTLRRPDLRASLDATVTGRPPGRRVLSEGGRSAAGIAAPNSLMVTMSAGPEATSPTPGCLTAGHLRRLFTAAAPESVAAFAVTAVRELTGAEVSWCALLCGSELKMAAHSGLRTVRMTTEWTLPLGVGIGGRVAATGRALSVRDYRHDPRRAPAQKTMIDEEGIRAAMCAPLVVAGRVLGVLYGAHRRPHDWDPREVACLVQIAGDSGVAVDRLTGRGACQTSGGSGSDAGTVDAVLELQADLAEVLCAAGDLTAGVILLRRRFGLSVDLVDAAGHSLLFPAPGAEPIRFRAALPGSSGERLEIAGDRAPDTDEQARIRAAALMFGIQLRAIRAGLTAQRRVGRDLVEALIGQSRDPGALRCEAALLGIDLDRPYRVACLGVRRDGSMPADEVAPINGAVLEQLDRAVGADHPGGLAVARNGDAVLVLPTRSGDRAADWLRELVGQRMHPRGTLSAGLGRLCSSAGDFAASYGEASLALELARSHPEPGVVLTAADLGLTGRLAAGGSSRRTLEAMVVGTLGPLLSADSAEGTEYVQTLRSWLAQDRHLERTAAQLHVHPNTVRYRVARAQDVLGIDLKCVDNRFQVELALRVLEALPTVRLDLPARSDRGDMPPQNKAADS